MNITRFCIMTSITVGMFGIAACGSTQNLCKQSVKVVDLSNDNIDTISFMVEHDTKDTWTINKSAFTGEPDEMQTGDSISFCYDRHYDDILGSSNTITQFEVDRLHGIPDPTPTSVPNAAPTP